MTRQTVVFVLLTLTALRAQRVFTRDKWPPAEWLRQRVVVRFGEDSAWFEFLSCAFCIGTWITFGVFGLASVWLDFSPHWALQAAAASYLVGFLDGWDR